MFRRNLGFGSISCDVGSMEGVDEDSVWSFLKSRSENWILSDHHCEYVLKDVSVCFQFLDRELLTVS